MKGGTAASLTQLHRISRNDDMGMYSSTIAVKYAHSPSINLAYNHVRPGFSVLQYDPLVDPINDMILEWLDDLV